MRAEREKLKVAALLIDSLLSVIMYSSPPPMSRSRSRTADDKNRSNHRPMTSGPILEELLPIHSEEPQREDFHLTHLSFASPQNSRYWPSVHFSDIPEWEREALSESLSLSLGDPMHREAKALTEAMERAQMTLEDLQSQLVRRTQWPLVRDMQSVDVTPAELAAIRSNVEQLQLKGYGEFSLGPVSVRARVVRRATSTETQLLREQAGLRSRHTAALSMTEKEGEFKHAKLLGEKRSLREAIEKLLQNTEITADLSSRLVTEEDTDRRRDFDLEPLRTEIACLRSGGLSPTAAQRELDFAEDLLVRVRNGEDKKQLLAQIEIVKSAIVQAKAQKAVTDTERIANAVDTSLRVLEKTRGLNKSKANIMRKVMERVSSRSTTDATELSFDSNRKPFVMGLKSPSDSWEHLRFLSGRNASREADNPYKEMMEVWQKRALQLQEKVKQYKACEDSMMIEKGKVKAALQEVQARKAAVDSREHTLFEQEVALALMEDRLRVLISGNLSPSEARSYLRERASDLASDRHYIEKDRFVLEVQWEKLQRKEAETAELRRVLERRMRKLGRDQNRVNELRAKVDAARKELKTFLPKLNAAY